MAITCNIDAIVQANFNHSHATFCYPKVVKCDFLPSGLLVPCGETWNCNLVCDTDTRYGIPLPVGGVMYLQTMFFDTVSIDRTIPDATYDDLITLEICSNLDPTNWITILSSEIGESNNCYDGQRNRQNLCINTGIIDPDIDCFSLKFTVGSECVETQQFIIERVCPAELVKLESLGFNDDCDGYFYGDYEFCNGAEITFSNVIYIRGTVKNFGGEVSSSYFGKLKTNTHVAKRARLIGSEIVPPYMSDYLLSQIFGGDLVLVNDVEYDSLGTISLTPSEKNSMFHVNIELQEDCFRSFGCS